MASSEAKEGEGRIPPEFLETLKEEYGLVQSKIDNIGDFKFKVRGWLITIYSAFLFGILSDRVSTFFCLPLGIIVVLLFHLMEREQLELQHKLSNRAKKIEKAIYLLIWNVKKNSARSITDVLLKEVKSAPRIGVIMTSGIGFGNFLRGMFTIKTNWLFITLYFLTFLVWMTVNGSLLPNGMVLIKGEDTSDIKVSIINNILEKRVNPKTMFENSSIDRVEEEMSSLVTQIEFGDISDIDAYWETLGEAILDLQIRDWNKPASKSKVSDIIASFNLPESKSLCGLTAKMEELCSTGSNSSISDEDLDKLQREASKFEKEFGSFLGTLDERIEK